MINSAFLVLFLFYVLIVGVTMDLKKRTWQQDPDQDYSLDEDDYDPYFDDMNQQQDKDNSWFIAAAAILGASMVAESLNPTGPTDSPSFPNHVEIPGDVDNDTASNCLGLDPSGATNYVFSDDEIAQYNQLKEDLQQYGRCADPATVENKAFSDAERVNDNIGMFGGTEAYKAGLIDTYAGYSDQTGTLVLIPWICAGGNPCAECEDIEAAGPYLPWEYPEPPHYACCCLPGDPIMVDLSTEGAVEAEAVNITYIYFLGEQGTVTKGVSLA